MFSCFLDTRRITVGKTLVFSVDVGVSTTGYTIDGFLFFDKHVPGEYLYRNTVTVRATPQEKGWSIRYNLTDDQWSENPGKPVEEDEAGWYVPLSSDKGFRARLRLQPMTWS